MTALHRDPVEGALAQVGRHRRLQRREELALEHLVGGTPHGLRAGHAVEPLERRVPAQDAAVEPHDEQAVVERGDDVLAELPQPVQLVGLDAQFGVQPAVLERRGHLAGDAGEQGEVLAVERLAAVAASHGHHRDRPVVGHARHEVVDAALAPRRHLARGEAPHRERVLERHRVAVLEPPPDAADQRDVKVRGRREPLGADHVPPAAVGVGQQRHALEAERRPHALHQAPPQPCRVEFTVEVAGEADQRPPVVVPVAVVRLVERRLDGVLDDGRQQHHHQRGQHGNHGVGLVGAPQQHLAGQLEDHGVDRRDRGDRHGVGDAPLDDDLDVHQAIADDGGGEGERDDAQREGQQLGVGKRVERQRERQDVEQHERQRAQRRAPHDPAQLPLRGHRRGAAQPAHHHGEPRHQAGGEVGHLEAIDRGQQRRHQAALAERPGHHQGAAEAQHRRRRVDRGKQRPAGRRLHPLPRPLGEHQGEVQEQRRQQQQGDDVGPVEHPVEPVEPPGEREGEDAEEGDAQPEEVERGLVRRAADAHRAADEEREDGHRREHEVQRAVALRHRLHLELHQRALPGPKHGVGEPVSRPRGVENLHHLVGRLHGMAVDGDEQVTGLQAGRLAGRPGADLGREHALGPPGPQHAVLHLGPAGAQRDVRGRQHQQARHEDEERTVVRPRHQAGTGGRGGNGGVHRYRPVTS